VTPKLCAALEECSRHVRYMKYAIARLPHPVRESDLAAPRDELVAALDQFAYRFIRLQDALGRGVLRLVLTDVFREPYEDAPFRDVLDRLERLGVIPSAERWEEGRAIRNTFTHDYPETPAAKAASLNAALEMARELERITFDITAKSGAGGEPRAGGP
jgi:hypothetical protein